jgi:hypothetical protein
MYRRGAIDDIFYEVFVWIAAGFKMDGWGTSGVAAGR